MIEICRNKKGEVVALKGKTVESRNTGQRTPFHIGKFQFARCHITSLSHINGIRIDIEPDTTYLVDNADYNKVSEAIIEGMSQ